MKAKIGVALVLAAAGLVLILQNAEVTTVRFFFWQFSTSQIVLLSATGVVGFFLGFLAAKLLR